MKEKLNAIELVARTIRVMAAEAVQQAKSGHPGMPMGMADAAAVLWSDFINFNPADPQWLNRDRFVLSAGHGSMLLYTLLHLFGFDLSLAEIKNFRQWGSATPGHPEFGMTPGVECTTGPLGQGFGNGVGLALSGKLLAARYSAELFDYRVYGIVSDGDLMEGLAAEAASLAGHWRLGNLIYLYDSNNISIGGRTDITFTEDVAKRFAAYGWQVQCCDGHCLEELTHCLEQARAENDRPSLICARTIIGKGSPNKADSAGVHGAPLGEEELRLTKENLKWPLDQPFYVPPAVWDFCRSCTAQKLKVYESWQNNFQKWQTEDVAAAERLQQQLGAVPPESLRQRLLTAMAAENSAAATRALSGKSLQLLAAELPGLIGGSADLEPSNNTLIKGVTDVQAPDYSGRNLRFGVREHAMGAIANGLAYSGAWRPYTATFLVFSDYLRPALRLAALSHLPVLYIFTHDSFYVGEDGPTHQPIEQIASLRLIPNVNVYRPADGLETAMCYWSALQRRDGPSVLLFTRQNLPPLKRPPSWQPESVLQGAYIVTGEQEEDLVLIATGSEVSLALAAAEILAAAGRPARVLSMPCVELFLEQSASWRERLLPPQARRVVLEAGVSTGWERVAGSAALLISRDTFGASAPAEVLAEQFGFGAVAVAARIENWLQPFETQ